MRVPYFSGVCVMKSFKVLMVQFLSIILAFSSSLLLSQTQASILSLNNAGQDEELNSDLDERDTLFWQEIKDSTFPEDFEAYLDQFPNGIFVALAEIRLKKLQEATEIPSEPPPATPAQCTLETTPPNSECWRKIIDMSGRRDCYRWIGTPGPYQAKCRTSDNSWALYDLKDGRLSSSRGGPEEVFERP